MIETQRLLTRQFTLSDVDALFAWRTDEDVSKYLGTARHTREKTEERLRFYISCYEKYGFGMSCVAQKADGKLIGWSGLQPLEDSGEIEVGYAFDKHYWGKGFATEIASAWLRYGFEQAALQRIVAVTAPENKGSWHVMEKLGMKFEKRAKHYETECLFYALLRDEFKPVDSFYSLHK